LGERGEEGGGRERCWVEVKEGDRTTAV
jgi:hypothetical protein